MGCALACMILMTWAGRETTAQLDVFQVIEMRSLIGLAMLYPLVWKAGGLAAMRTGRPLLHIGRNLAHYSGQFGWLVGLTMIPLAQVISIEFTAPIWTAILAVTVLGERMTAWKLGAVTVGLLGVLIIVRPGVDSASAGQLVVLAAAFAFAVSYITTKALTRTDSVVTIIFWMLVIQSLMGLVPAVLVWKTPPHDIWPWILMIAFSGSYAHYCMARALAHADATVVVPMDFLRVPATVALGWLAYSETLDMLTLLGAALILAGNLLNLGGRRPSLAPTPEP
jgi:drug/metabolite transporter (DMT)-like permease